MENEIEDEGEGEEEVVDPELVRDSIIMNVRKFIEDHPKKHLCVKTIAANSDCTFQEAKDCIFSMYYGPNTILELNFNTMRFRGKKIDGSPIEDEEEV